jgi:hypothetical protein
MSEAYLDPLRAHCRCTASNLADAIASLGYNSRTRYAQRLLGLKPQQESTERMRQGQRYEPWIAEAYAAFTGNEVRLLGFGVLKDDERFGASPDYEVRTPQGESFLLEIKTTSDAFDSPFKIPVCHVLQMLGQCRVFGHAKSHYARYSTYTKEFYICEVVFEPQLWAKHVWPRLKDFMDAIDRKEVPGRVSSLTKSSVQNAVDTYTTVRPVFLSDPLAAK